MNQIKTAKEVAYLLKMRRELINAQCNLIIPEMGATYLQDNDGLKEIRNLAKKLQKLTTKYRNLIPYRHIDGVEIEMKKLGFN